MRALVYLINKTRHLVDKKKIGKSLFLLSVISIAAFLFVVFVDNNANNKKQEKLLASYKQIPLEGEFVQQELIIQFHEGYSPDELKEAIKKKQNSSLILKPFIYVRTVASSFYGGLDSKETLVKIDNKLKDVGVATYSKLVEDASSNSLSRYYRLSFNRDINLKLAQEKLSQLYYIASTEPNRIFHVDKVPDDPSYPQLWGIQKIQSPQAWDTTIGSQSITVAVIDSGIDASHPEFAGRILAGYDYINNDSDPDDDLGHGTHVAGTIGAIGNNGVGVVGVNWDVKILPIRVCKRTNNPPKYNTCNLNAAIPGIQYAINNNAKVVNMSLGGPGSCGFALQNAISDGIDAGITFAIAAGNETVDASVNTPANCNGVITVGSTTSSDSRSSFSNFGSTVEIAAPGSGIVSTILGGQYGSKSGTSMAAPHVAGAVALLLSVSPSLSPREVSDCLVQNADTISPDKPIGPRLNIARAIENCRGSNPVLSPINSPTPLITNVPSTFSMSINIWTDNNNDGVKDGSDTPYQGAIVDLIGPINSSGTTDSLGDLVFSNLPSGIYSIGIINILGYSITPYTLTISDNTLLTLRLSPGAPLSTPVIITQPVALTPVATSVPTSAPLPTGGGSRVGSPTPTPTPIVTYKCEIDQDCIRKSGQKNLQFCPLICMPQ